MYDNTLFVYSATSESTINTDTQSLLKLIKSDNSPNLSEYQPVTNRGFQFNVNMLRSADDKKKKALGCMMGLVTGDALGAPLEFKSLRYPPHQDSQVVTEMLHTDHFGLRPGQYTDDTSMSLCLADSLIIKKQFDPFDIMLRFQAWWHCGYNNCFMYDDLCDSSHSIGLGGSISKSLTKFTKDGEAYTSAGDLNTSGNGSIMRNAPICLNFCSDISSAMKYAELQSKITHQGTEAWENARLLTWICVNLINSNSCPLDLLQIVQRFDVISNDVNIVKLINSSGDWDWKNEYFRYNKKRATEQPKYIGSYSTDCLAMALHCVYTTGSFEEALIKAVNMCGDADSVGAVTGQIAGAMYGYDEIPIRWLQATTYWNAGSILYRAHLLYEHGNMY